MRNWKLRLVTLIVCASWSAIACSGDTEPTDQSRTDVASTGGSGQDGFDDTTGEVRDLSGNCQGLTVGDDVSCNVAGLFCHDDSERRCVCGGLAPATPAAEDGNGGRGDRGDRRTGAPAMTWECLGEVPLGGGANGALGGATSNDSALDGLGGAQR